MQGTRLSSSALERRVKRWLLQAPFDAFLQSAPGLEPTLLRELGSLGLAGSHDAATEPGGVILPLDLEGLLRANLELRTAGRVLLRLATFPAANPEMLFDRARRIPWEVHLGFHENFSLRMSARHSKLQAGDYLAKTVAAAIGRRMGELGLGPRLTDESPLTFRVRLHADRCTISLDTSGAHLHRRSVRIHVHAAPLRETLAAAMLLEGLAGMERSPDVVVDPFCGSGTLLVEAVDALFELPPGRNRGFAFEEAAWHRPGRWREVKRQAGFGVRGGGSTGSDRDAGGATPGERSPAATSDGPDSPVPRFLGIDIDAGALHAARANLFRPEYSAVELRQADSRSVDLDTLGARSGLLVANLPYGVRLGGRRASNDVVRSFLERLAAGRTPWRVALLSADRRLVEPSLRNSRTLETSNGGLRVWLTTGEIGGG